MDPFRTILSLNPGDLLLGRYKLLDRLGRGAMGEVWKAEDQHTGRTYALKILPPEFIGSEAADKRMKAEAAIGQDLSHDAIVRLYTYERDPTRGNVSFLVMEFVEGRTLERILDKEGPQPLDRVLAWAKDLAAGIDYAHERKVLHRDIKPGNVMIESATDRARLLDFGIGREIRNTMSVVSQRDDSSGTPAYMSPQQLMGKNDKSNDIYSLAATIYHALAGRPPFTEGHIQTQILHQQPAPIAGLPDHVNRILILGGLAKSIEERPASAVQLIADTGSVFRSITTCSFCLKTSKEVGPTVEGPELVFVCKPCVVSFSRSKYRTIRKTYCSFCGKDAGKYFQSSHSMKAPSPVRICPACISLCVAIYAQHSALRETSPS